MYTFCMTIIPAIDLLDGKCVRLYRGDYDRSTEYKLDPVEVAKQFFKEGARRIHLVDLNAARSGAGDRATDNRKIIAAVRATVPEAVLEVGGGIRTTQDVENLKEIGVDRLIVGTVLVKNPDLVAQWAARYPNTFIAGIDARDGEVRISGWEEGSAMTDTEAARIARESGAVSIIYTNIERDGTLQGPDIENSLMVADAGGLPVIVSGGIRGPEDFEEIQKFSADRIAGVITGKAIYEQRIKLSDVIAAYQSPASKQGEHAGLIW